MVILVKYFCVVTANDAKLYVWNIKIKMLKKRKKDRVWTAASVKPKIKGGTLSFLFPYIVKNNYLTFFLSFSVGYLSFFHLSDSLLADRLTD